MRRRPTKPISVKLTDEELHAVESVVRFGLAMSASDALRRAFVFWLRSDLRLVEDADKIERQRKFQKPRVPTFQAKALDPCLRNPLAR